MQESIVDGQIRLLEMVVQGKPLKTIFDAMLRFCEARFPDMLCSILTMDPDGKHLRYGSAPSLPQEYMAALDGSAIGPCNGSCGTAAFNKDLIIVEDITTDPLWVEHRRYAAPHHLRACWSMPILNAENRVLGTFAIYYRKPAKPSKDHLQLINMVAHLAGIAMTNRQVEEERVQMFERISDAFVALDPEWRFTYVNPKAGLLIEREPQSLIGKDVWTEFPGLLGKKFHSDFQKAMDEQQPMTLEEFVPYFGKWFESRIYPSPQGLSIYFSDVTKRKVAQDRDRQNEKLTAIGQLAGGIAHDFNNQLSIMLGYAGLLETRVSEPELKRYASAIVRAANRSGDLTRNLLTFSHQGHFESVPVDFHDLITEVVEFLKRSIDKRISIVTNLTAARAVVHGDPATLQNAVLNLALNARDAMPEGGILEFATEVVEGSGNPGPDQSQSVQNPNLNLPRAPICMFRSKTRVSVCPKL